MSHWWRAYDEAVDDPKLGVLSDRVHRAWFNLCCLASANSGVLPPIAAVAFKLRVSEHKAAELITALISAGLFDRRPDGKFEPHNWEGRQFKSDVSTARVKRFRERQRNGEAGQDGDVSGTPPDSETDSEPEKEKKGNAREPRALRSSEFEDQVWKPYPRTPVMSKEETWKAWRKCSEADRQKIIAAIPRYAAWLRSRPDHPAVHACRFITQRRFDGFGEPEAEPDPNSPEAYAAAAAARGMFYAAKGSEQLAAWDEHRRKTRGGECARDRNGGWTVESEWPPGHPKRLNGG